ncbi:MAG: 16S rRNA (cytosine(1402)-N(4))-methyltransferase RsmH [bacterium]
MIHKPVLLKEVLEYLDPSKGENFIDCTFGFGGHSFPLLEMIKPNGKVLGIEKDKKVLEIFENKQLNKRLILVQGNFTELKKIVEDNNFYSVNGILFDLGISSWQIEKSGQGFSFQKDEPLIMNSIDDGLTAEQIINKWSEKELVRIFHEYSQERYSHKIAREICRIRHISQIKTTGQLVKIIENVVPEQYKHKGIHFATRVFQALRIAVNNELDNLEKALPLALDILEKNGRLAVISFHSLEDRIVKNFFREKAKENILKILTKKPIVSKQEEIEINPRSRSAKLRVVVKI